MEQNNQQFKCSGDCLNCRSMQDRKIQWQYCAAQFTYNSMRMIEVIQGKMESLGEAITALQAKMEAIQNSESVVFDPTHITEPDETVRTKETAQIGDGAESRNPGTKQN